MTVNIPSEWPLDERRVVQEAFSGKSNANVQGGGQNRLKRIFKVVANNKTFTMISMTDITVEQALIFAQGKWDGAEVS